jgi:hypothetical protein
MDHKLDSSEYSCSQISQATGIPLHGTATEAQVWILLEYSEKWPAQWLHGNTLPPNIQTWTHYLEEQIPKSRVAFIKQENHRSVKSLYLAVTDPSDPRLHHFEWNDYDDLLDLDLPAVVNGDSAHGLVQDRLVCVCTHGLRDRCCAKLGLPVYSALTGEPMLDAWEITHVGGHRFAANATIFPSGIMYGYVTPTDAPIIGNAARNNSIHLPNYRGRSFYDEPTNAADYFLRAETKVLEDGFFYLVNSEATCEGVSVTFSGDGIGHHIDVTATPSLDVVSCGKPKKTGVIYNLLSHETYECL